MLQLLFAHHLLTEKDLGKIPEKELDKKSYKKTKVFKCTKMQEKLQTMHNKLAKIDFSVQLNHAIQTKGVTDAIDKVIHKCFGKRIIF